MKPEIGMVLLHKNIEESNVKNKGVGTPNFISGLMEQHEFTAWMLRGYLN